MPQQAHPARDLDLRGGQPARREGMAMIIEQARIARTLNPRTVVVVGDKGPTYNWLTNQKEFAGELYSVQVDPVEIAGIEERGFRNFTSLAEVPGEVDLVICVVPRNVAPRIIADAAAKHVGGVAMFTAGFAETKEPLGIELQSQIVQIANDAGMAIVGPNCMGVYNRRLGIRFGTGMEHAEGGNVSYVSQSGSIAGGITTESQAVGLQVTRTISSGNAAVVNEADYLEYLAGDPDTQYIGMYLEGMHDGRRFFQQLRDVTKTKPVVIFKGGSNAVGAQATDSHTGSLSTPPVIWEAMVRQAGGISVETREELIDTMAALVRAPVPRGKRMALLAGSGGSSVAIADAAGRAGLTAPPFSARSSAALGEFFVTAGGSYGNPLDMGSTVGMRGAAGNLARILDIVASDPAFDGAIYQFGAFGRPDPERQQRTLDAIDAFRDRWGKPIMMVCPLTTNLDAWQAATSDLVAHGYPVYPSFDRAARALSRVTDYWANRVDREG
jgi:acyl-CoA synthetase (NDP forming)